ncbi:hypothetical protein ACFQH7_11030 [Microbulbifer taiwanensis]
MFQVIVSLTVGALFAVTAQGQEPKPATAETRKANAAVLKALPFKDQQDFKDIKRGFIEALPNKGMIKNSSGETVWDLSAYEFADGKPAPDTVNPSLWRQLQLLSEAGLYQVAPGIYQVRGADLSNITFIEGDRG